MSWETVKLGDVTAVSRGTTITKKQTVDGNIPVIGGGIKPTYFHNEFNRDAGVITISGSGASAGFVNYWEEPIFASDCSTVQPFDKSYETKFLYFFLLSKQQFIFENFRSGAAQPHVYAKDIATLDIPKIDLSVQKQVVKKLDAAFDGIDKAISATEKNIENAEALSLKYFDSLFEPIMESADKLPLIDFCREITVGHVGSMKERYVEKGIFFLRSQNVRPFEISMQGMKYIDAEFNSELKKSQLASGDVVAVRTGYPGTCAVIPKTINIANCSDLVIFKPKCSLNPHFLELFFNTPLGKEIVLGKLVGAAQQHFNIGSAKKVMFPKISLDQQEIILKAATIMREKSLYLASQYQNKIVELANLKASILNQAFSGEFTKDAA